MTNVTQLNFKDGDDGSSKHVIRASVTPVENGYILDVGSDEDDWQEVFTSKSELLERIKDLL